MEGMLTYGSAARQIDLSYQEWVMDAKQVGKVMQAHRNRLSLTQDQVVFRTDVPSAQYLSALENGRYDIRNSEHFQSLVTLYGLGAEQVREIHPAAIVEVVSSLPIHEGPSARQMSDGEMVEMPVYGMASASPDGNCASRPPDTTALVPARYIRPNRCAYLVEGSSMDGGDKPIRHGDVVICDHGETDLQDGRVYIVRVMGNGILLKRVRVFDGVPELQSDNRDHRTLRPDEAQIIGLVVAVVPQVFVP